MPVVDAASIVRNMPNDQNRLVVILAYDQLCPFEFASAFEVFGLSRPEMGPGWYRSVTAAAEDGPLRGGGGLSLTPDGGLELLEQAGTIIIPGWRGPDAPAPKPLLCALQKANEAGTRILSICGGAFVLAEAGLLAGKKATTHWHHLEKLAQRYPEIEVVDDVLYVEQDNILTSAGSAAGLDLCIHVVREDFGADAANSVARRLVLSAPRQGQQAQYLRRSLPPASGIRVSSLLDIIRERLNEKWSVARMAAEAHVSPRSLQRHIREATGLAPGAWLQQQRIAYARDLLHETGLSVEEIAQASGFGTATNFRQHFRQTLGLSPMAYRHKMARHETLVGTQELT